MHLYIHKLYILFVVYVPGLGQSPLEGIKSGKTIVTYFHNTDNKCMAISSYNFSWFVPIQKTSQRKIRSIPIGTQKYSYKFTYLIRSNDSWSSLYSAWNTGTSPTCKKQGQV